MTGGIGSGKTTVAKVFELLGVPVYYADLRAKSIIDEIPAVKESIIRHFGEQSFVSGKYNRSFISSIVFNNPEKLKLLNDIVHPFTLADANEWMKKQSAPYSIKEAALIFESGSNLALDKVIGVSSPIELRVKRVSERDGITPAEVMKKIELQMPEYEKMQKCDYHIMNDEHKLMIPQIMELHQSLLALSASF